MFKNFFGTKNKFSYDSIIKSCDMLESDPNSIPILIEDYMTVITNIVKSGEKCKFSKEQLFFYSFVKVLCIGIYTIEYEKFAYEMTEKDEKNILSKINSNQDLINKVYHCYNFICEHFNYSIKKMNDEKLTNLFSFNKLDYFKFSEYLNIYSQ